MSRSWVWIATGLSAAFLAAAGVVLGTRLVGAQPGDRGSGAACAAQLQQAQVEVARLRRLVAAYRDREAVYRQRLEEANRLVERLSARPREERWDRWDGRTRREREEWWEHDED